MMGQLIFIALTKLIFVPGAIGHPFAKDLKRQQMMTPVPRNLDTETIKIGEHYRVKYVVKPDGNIPLRQHHSWVFSVRPIDGEIVDDVSIKVLGDMPQHGHGLPTVPKVQKLDATTFLVRGMMLHMHGWWQIEVRVESPAIREAFKFNLIL